MSKKKQAKQSEDDGELGEVAIGLSSNVVQMYKEIGEYMSHYRSGKIPKAFKSIPALMNWEQILE
jgi:essential nuclear protein 1